MQSIQDTINSKDYLEKLAARAKKSKELGLQSTPHQQDAIETAELFKDTSKRSIGIYMALFKKRSVCRYDMLQLRDWVMGLADCDNRGKLFVWLVHKKL